MKWGIFLTLFLQGCLLYGSSWVSGNHETEFANYYLGVSGPDKDRNSALNTALSNALEKAGIERSSIYIESFRSNMSKSSTIQKVGGARTSISGNSNSESFGETKKRFSSTIDKITLVEEYWDGSIGYALIRIPKTGFDSFNFHDWNIRENRKRKLVGGIKSAVLPGWGSFYQQKPMRGTFFLLSTLASASYIYTAYSNYNNSIDLMNVSVIGSDKNRFFKEAQGYSREYNIGLISLSAVYLWNVLDPILFPGEYRDYFYLKRRYNKSELTAQSQKRYNDIVSLSSWQDELIELKFVKIETNPLGYFLESTDILSQIMPKWYFGTYETDFDSLLFVETGFSVGLAFADANILGIHPFVGVEGSYLLGSMTIEFSDAIMEQYDQGYGLVENKVFSENFGYRFNMGVQRWFGRLKLFMGTSISPEYDLDWSLNVYTGENDTEGNKEADSIEIDANTLGISPMKYGGSNFFIGLSFGY